jgi:hypothetical protein
MVEGLKVSARDANSRRSRIITDTPRPSKGAFRRWWMRRMDRQYWAAFRGVGVYPQTQGFLPLFAERHALQAEFEFSQTLKNQ